MGLGHSLFGPVVCGHVLGHFFGPEPVLFQTVLGIFGPVFRVFFWPVSKGITWAHSLGHLLDNMLWHVSGVWLGPVS